MIENEVILLRENEVALPVSFLFWTFNQDPVFWGYFKWNFKNFKQDLSRLKEYASVPLDRFCMKSQIEGQRIHKLFITANSVGLDLIQAKWAVLPSSWWILCPSIQDFMQNIFWAPEAHFFTCLRLRWKVLQSYSKFCQNTVSNLQRKSFLCHFNLGTSLSTAEYFLSLFYGWY